jgi:hypothetical protein
MPRPAKKQKLDRASRELVAPIKNAKAFVIEVIVIDVPAFTKAYFILISTESLGLV